jgi:ATP-binding cassette subfamily A (ABC1) protein 3
MQEAETLCHKIGILINGRFKSYGTPDELRDRHGQGFTVVLQLSMTQSKEALLPLIRNTL